MKRQILISLILLTSILTTNAQWSVTDPVWTNSKVGIGTNSPNCWFYSEPLLHLSGVRPTLSFTPTNQNGLATIQWKGISNGSEFHLNFADGETAKLVFSSYQSAGGTSPALAIQGNGNIGIGTIAPVSALNVAGTTNLSWGSSASGLVTIGTQSTGGSLFVNTNSATSGYAAGLGVNGSSISGSGTLGSLININAYGVNYAGYYSTLAFSVTNGTSLNEAMRINGNGNVGIGTTNPESKLHINSYSSGAIRIAREGSNTFGYEIGGSSYGLFDYTSGQYKWRTGGGDVFLVETSGSVGIGTPSPESKLHINSYSSGAIRIAREGSNTFGYEIGGSTFGLFDYTNGQYKWRTGGGDVFLVETSGSVGIGTIETGTHKLAVEGTIGAREIKVEAGTWSDFVFDKDYKLKDLEEVESFIEENNHLPDVPSEKEVLQNGIQLGEMNATLLQKIEELTLYMIEQNKETKTIKAQLDNLTKENEVLKAKITNLESTK